MGISFRVPGFLPSINGLHFSNTWPNVPDFYIDIFGEKISFDNASNGLCGGMVFTVRDLFESHFLPPADTANPLKDSPFFTYIVTRLAHSFDPSNLLKFFQFIQLRDFDTRVDTVLKNHQLSYHVVYEEWPRIKADLEANHLTPMALVHGHQPFGDIIDTLKVMGGGHVVMAWGYDLDGTQLTIHIYDPNYANDDHCTISLDISKAPQTTPMQFSHYNYPDDFRGFFHYKYEYHNPTLPVSAAVIEQIVSSPGITPGNNFLVA